MRVYRLIAIELGDRMPNGVAAAHKSALGVFASVEKAEAMIRIHREKMCEFSSMVGYALYEHQLDDLSLHGPWKQIPEFLSVRTYLADGTLNAVCDCDSTCEKAWRGRDAATIHFKRGDFVSVWQGDRIVPMLIGGVPSATKEKIVGDWSDDCYLAYSISDGHSHPFAPYVFPLVADRTLTERMKRKLLDVREREEAPVAAGGPNVIGAETSDRRSGGKRTYRTHRDRRCVKFKFGEAGLTQRRRAAENGGEKTNGFAQG